MESFDEPVHLVLFGGAFGDSCHNADVVWILRTTLYLDLAGTFVDNSPLLGTSLDIEKRVRLLGRFARITGLKKRRFIYGWR